MSPRPFLPVRRLVLALALAALGLSQAACSSLSRPDEIAISAEPVRSTKKEAAVPAPAAPAPAPAAPAGTG